MSTETTQEKRSGILAAIHEKRSGVLFAINAVQHDLRGGIGKGQKNVAQGYAFRGIDDLLNSVGPLLPKHGLVILPRCTSREQAVYQSKSGGRIFHVVVKVEYRFKATNDGSEEIVEFYGESLDTSDKATNKAMSAALKYCYIQTFAIAVEGEPDADADSPIVPAENTPVKKPTFGKVLTDEEAEEMWRKEEAK